MEHLCNKMKMGSHEACIQEIMKKKCPFWSRLVLLRLACYTAFHSSSAVFSTERSFSAFFFGFHDTFNLCFSILHFFKLISSLLNFSVLFLLIPYFEIEILLEIINSSTSLIFINMSL